MIKYFSAYAGRENIEIFWPTRPNSANKYIIIHNLCKYSKLVILNCSLSRLSR